MLKSEITAIIVEDIKDYHRVIETFVQEVSPHVKIVGNAYTLKEAEKLIRELNPDLLFLDIQFEAEGRTAFDMLHKFAKQDGYPFQVIITTAHDEQKYYAEAFNLGAVHFLMKPIDKEKLGEALDRVQKKQPVLQFSNLLDQMQQIHNQLHQTKFPDRFIIEGMNYSEVVLLKDIVYLETENRYTNIYLVNSLGKPICSTLNIGEYAKKLLPVPSFFRIHRNAIVNVNYVVRYFKKDRVIVLTPPFEKQYAAKDRFKEFVDYMTSRGILN